MRFRTLVLGACVLGMLAYSVGSAWGDNPPGNNGTVKVDGLGLGDQANDPHVSCLLYIDFSGFDQGSYSATMTFELLPPSGTGVLFTDSTPIGAGPVSVPEDLSSWLQLSGATPQPGQGFHVQLTVHAEGSIGSDVKHKTFWATDCGGE